MPDDGRLHHLLHLLEIRTQPSRSIQGGADRGGRADLMPHLANAAKVLVRDQCLSG